MIVHLINIHNSYVFKRYLKKYNIYRDLYEIDLLGLEIRNLNKELADNARHIIFRSKEICYVRESDKSNNQVDLLILGSFGIFRDLAKDIVAVGNEDLGYRINRVLQSYSAENNYTIKLTGKNIKIDKTIVMGILNVTPDSFSDGGKFFVKEEAVQHGLELLQDGAHIIDIGGESTRPGADDIPVDEEINRVLPVIEEIKKQKKDAVISIDTRKVKVAEAALDAGADIVNDISGGDYSREKMFDFCAQNKIPLILMHMKGTPGNMQQNPYYDDVVLEIYDYLYNKIKTAEKYGVKNIIIDPGIGFGKRVNDNYELLTRLKEFKGLGKQILVGVSRKSFIGKVLNLDKDEREDATLAAETLAIQNGADIIRTHKVKNTLYAAEICKYFQNPELTN